MSRRVNSTYGLRFVINALVGLFLVLSQFTMSHAMSLSHTDHASDCAVSGSVDHCATAHGSHADHPESPDTSLESDIDTNSSSHHGKIGHCATACASAVLPTVLGSVGLDFVDVQFDEVRAEPTPATIQGLKRPPKP